MESTTEESKRSRYKKNWTTEESQWYANVDPSQQRADKDPYSGRQNQPQKNLNRRSGTIRGLQFPQNQTGNLRGKVKKIEYEKQSDH